MEILGKSPALLVRSLVKERSVFRCLPLFSLVNSRETQALSHANSRVFSVWKSH